MSGRSWDEATRRGCDVVRVKQKFARLTVYIRAPDHDTCEAVCAELRRLADESERICEACGQPGQRWGDEERAAVSRAIGRPVTRWSMTLCCSCAWRYYVEDARRWDEVRGEWSPPIATGWSPETDAENEDG